MNGIVMVQGWRVYMDPAHGFLFTKVDLTTTVAKYLLLATETNFDALYSIILQGDQLATW